MAPASPAPRHDSEAPCTGTLLHPRPPAALATDWDSVFLFMTPQWGGRVWEVEGDEMTTGWDLTRGEWGGYGRKVRGGGRIHPQLAWVCNGRQGG